MKIAAILILIGYLGIARSTVDPKYQHQGIASAFVLITGFALVDTIEPEPVDTISTEALYLEMHNEKRR